MSYNVDRFKVMDAVNFSFNKKGIYEEEYTAEVFAITHNQNGYIKNIELCGERSGSFYDTFKLYLEDSSGYLKALEIWEGGDTIRWITIKNGKIKYENI